MKNIINRVLQLHKDNKGRYLEVPKNDLILLDIENLISGDSFENASYVYLDFGIDTTIYMVASHKEGWNIKINQIEHKEIPCRKYRYFYPHNEFSKEKQKRFLDEKRIDTRNLFDS